MVRPLFSAAALSKILLVFFVYCCLAPTVRLLLVGGGEMHGLYDAFITMLPDLLLGGVLLFSVITYTRSGRFVFSAMDKLVLVYFGFNVIYGTLLSGNLFIAAQGFRLSYLPVTFYFVARVFSGHQPEAKTFLRNLGLWLLLFGVIGILLHFCFRDQEVWLIRTNNSKESVYFIPRIGSLVLMPVLFATLMALACLYFFHRLLSTGIWWNYLCIALAWSCIFLSVSRGPILAFILAFLFMTVISRQWLRGLAVFILIAAVSSAWSWALLGSLAPLSWLFSSAADTLSFGEGVTRVELWKRSIHDFLARPWGFGLGKAGTIAIRFLKGTGTPSSVYTSDGWYLKQLCETGVVGLLTYLAPMFVFLRKGLRYLRQSGNATFLFIMAFLILINAQCVVGNTLDFYPSMCIYWLILGFGVNFLDKEQPVRNEA